jgi:hypothetical protein
VAARWAAIPPPPDARREMLSRVMELSESLGASSLSAKGSRNPEPVTGPHKPYVPRKSPEPVKSPPPVTGPHKPFIPRTSPKPFPPKPSKETAAAETLSPPPLVAGQATSPSIRALEDAAEEVHVPRPAPVPNIELRGKPLTLRPPQPFAPAQSSAPGSEPKPPPIKAVAVRGSETLDGLSSTISSSKLRARSQPSSMPPLPPLSSPAPRTTSKPPVLSASPTPLPPSPGDVSVALADGITLVRPASAQWQPHPLWKGTSVKLLSHDTERGEYTALIRLSKGSSLPPRRHVSTEEMWMIEGVALVGEIEMRAGEYSKGDAAAVHPKIVSTSGCTFLLRGNENDEILSAPSGSFGK